MKKENIDHLIAELIRVNDWVSAGILASQLHTTTRSVRNYVSEINKDKNPAPILASHQGYKWNGTVNGSFDMLNDLKPEVCDNPKDRCWYLIRKILFRNTMHLNPLTFSDACRILSVSDATLASDIVLLRKLLSAYDCRLHIRNDCLSLSAEETEFRHLLHDTITYHLGTGQFFISDLDKAFPQYRIRLIKNKLLETMQAVGMTIDSYHISDLILYIVVQFIRFSNGRFLTEAERLPDDLLNTHEYAASEIFSGMIAEQSAITYSFEEVLYLTLLLKCFCTENSPVHCLDHDIYDHTLKCLERIERREQVKFDDQFIHTAADFFERLELRCRYHIFAYNPVSSSIRNNSINEFNASVWMCTDFNVLWNTRIPRSEIAYFTMIMKNQIDTLRTDKPDISCTLVYPDYFGSRSLIMARLRSQFGHQLSIQYTVDDPDTEIPQSDITISVLNLQRKKDFTWISPQLTDNDCSAIRKQLDIIHTKRRYRNFLLYLECYSSQIMFERNHNFSDSAEAVGYICQKLSEMHYTDPAFTQQVLLRENADSTVYHNLVAVPHANTADVRNNSLYIVLNDKPVNWGKRKANLIILVAMQRDLIQDFRYFYEMIIKMFENKHHMSMLLEARNYNDFLMIIRKISAVSV